MRYEDLESQASALNIMNHSAARAHRRRKASVPAHILNDKNYVFGIKSDVILPDKNAYSTVESGSSSLARSTNYGMRSAASSSMQQLMAHSDNMKASLQNKINMKLQFEAIKQKYHRSALSKGNVQTRASELRTQAQLTNKVLNEMNHSIEVARANKAGTN